MMRTNRVALVLGLIACSAVPLEASEPTGPADEVGKEFVVVNGYRTQVLVYVEDSDGRVGLMGRVSRGEIKRFTPPADVTEGGRFRVKVYPVYNPDPWSGWNDAGIRTQALNLQTGATLIVWVAKDLAESSVEQRAG